MHGKGWGRGVSLPQSRVCQACFPTLCPVFKPFSAVIALPSLKIMLCYLKVAQATLTRGGHDGSFILGHPEHLLGLVASGFCPCGFLKASSISKAVTSWELKCLRKHKFTLTQRWPPEITSWLFFFFFESLTLKQRAHISILHSTLNQSYNQDTKVIHLSLLLTYFLWLISFRFCPVNTGCGVCWRGRACVVGRPLGEIKAGNVWCLRSLQTQVRDRDEWQGPLIHELCFSFLKQR